MQVLINIYFACALYNLYCSFKLTEEDPTIDGWDMAWWALTWPYDVYEYLFRDND